MRWKVWRSMKKTHATIEAFEPYPQRILENWPLRGLFLVELADLNKPWTIRSRPILCHIAICNVPFCHHKKDGILVYDTIEVPWDVPTNYMAIDQINIMQKCTQCLNNITWRSDWWLEQVRMIHANHLQYFHLQFLDLLQYLRNLLRGEWHELKLNSHAFLFSLNLFQWHPSMIEKWLLMWTIDLRHLMIPKLIFWFVRCHLKSCDFIKCKWNIFMHGTLLDCFSNIS